MATDDERREVARRLRGGYDVVSDAHGRFWLNGTLFGMDITARSEEQIRDGLARLADLIEPTDGFDLDTVQRVCFECMEGCDEPEWTLYTTIYDAIARYKRGESGPTCDRDALLALADEMDAEKNFVLVGGYARRIREALGAKS